MRVSVLVLIISGCSFDPSAATAVDEPGGDSEPSLVPFACPGGYDEAPTGTCYRLVRQRQDWTAAEAACEADRSGSHLVVIDDAFENNYLAEYIGDDEVWIGLTRTGETSFAWVTGGSADFFKWESDAPDSQECVILRNKKATGGWDDKDCPDSYVFVCEYDAIVVN